MHPLPLFLFCVSFLPCFLLEKTRQNKTKQKNQKNPKNQKNQKTKKNSAAIFLKDMIFFNDGNPNKLQGGELINIEKLRMMTDQIKAMTLMAHVPYKFKEDPPIKNYIQNPRVETLQTLLKLSNELEPKK